MNQAIESTTAGAPAAQPLRKGADQPPVLVYENVRKTYGDFVALNGVSLQVNKGEVMCLIGPSGSGKSTLLRCTNALKTLNGGRVLLDGVPLPSREADVRKVRQRMGMVFQSFELFPHKTALDNVAMGPVTVLGMSEKDNFGPSPTEAPGDASGLAFLEAWRTARLLDTHRKPMGSAGLGQAQFVWRRWLAFCSGCRLYWRRTMPADLRAFPATFTPRQRGASLAVSPVTIRRYWRILNDLYAHAALTGQMEANPALKAMPAVSEKTSSMALRSPVWALPQEDLPAGFAPRPGATGSRFFLSCAARSPWARSWG